MSSATTSPAPLPTSDRIVSLDQFRGYTVVGMLLVNFVGGFAACPKFLSHSHDYISYADTIMPQFLFAVGFAFRLTFGRREQFQGISTAYGRPGTCCTRPLPACGMRTAMPETALRWIWK